MGRYTGAACKLCRREGMKLFLKGDRCYMAKCPIETGRPVPGAKQGMRRRTKPSDYAIQLREKQRLRRFYGLQEGQFRLTFQRAARRRGVTGEVLLQLLEMRLDNLVYRLGFAPSRRAARQFVRHEHIRVNGRKASIPSMTLSEQDVIEVGMNPRSREYATQGLKASESRGPAAWLTLDAEGLKGTVDRIPSREEINPFVNETLVVELYSK